jgi:hypothetical protein
MVIQCHTLKLFSQFWRQFWWKNTVRRKEKDGNAIGEDTPREEVRYRRWCQKWHNED